MKKNIKSIFLLTLLVLLLVGITSVNATDDLSANNTDNTVTQIDTTPTSTVQNNIINDNKEIQKTNTKSVKTDGNDNIDYYVSDTDGQDTNTGTQESPFKTIQTAIDKTTADKTYNIYIAEGTYKGLGNTNLTVNGNYNINFIGSNQNNTIIDGEAKYDIDSTQYHWSSSDIWSFYVNGTGNWIMNITKGDGNISLSTMTIQNAWSPGIDGGDRIDKYLVATVDNYGNLHVDNVNFLNNHGGVGSAIRNNNNATLEVTNSMFEGNRKSISTGNDGIIYNNGTLNIINSTFNKNYARWGTILNDNRLTITNSTISNNIGYDGQSTYDYGPGIAFNTGEADFYNEGYYLTYNDIINCTFINNQKTDIYAPSGYLNATGNKFINSTGLFVSDKEKDVDYKFNISNNTFEGLKIRYENTVSSSSSYFCAIESTVSDHEISIQNNKINVKNGTAIIINTANITDNNIIVENGLAIELQGDNSIIKNNYIDCLNSSYTITTTRTLKNNIITDNDLLAKDLFGDYAVLRYNTRNIVENNTPEVLNTSIYVSPDVNSPSEGSINNPTTLSDALLKIEENASIVLLYGTNGHYILNQSIIINSENVNPNTKRFSIIGSRSTSILDGQNKVNIFNITEGYDISISNITLQNGKNSIGGLIYSESNLNISNSNFVDSYADIGGAIFTNGNSNVIINNNTFKNIASLNETLYLNNTGTKQLNYNAYIDSDIKTKLIISCNSNKINLNDTVYIDIDEVTLVNPEFYDSNLISSQTKLLIYENDVNTQNTTQRRFTIDTSKPISVTIKVKTDISEDISNELTLEIIYENSRYVTVSNPDILSMGVSVFNTTVLDEFEQKVNEGSVSYYVDGSYIGSVDVVDSNAIFSTDQIYSLGEHDVLVTYNSSSNKYYNQSTRSKLLFLNQIYVSADATEANLGTYDNPTTINDALNKITENKTIILLPGEHSLSNIKINSTNVPNAKSFNIYGFNENVTWDAQKKMFLTIEKGYSVNINNVNFKNGYSTNYDINNKGTLILTNTTFENNYANTYGVIYSPANTNLIINNTNKFINNRGSALYVVKASLTINNYNEFINNTGKNGGAVYITNPVSFEIKENNKFINNYGKNGGAIYKTGNQILKISNSIFINNSATNGGTIYGAALFLENNLIENDSATQGGAIYCNNYQLTLKNNTFNNVKSDDETIYLSGDITTDFSDNKYSNCSIQMNINITLDENHQTPIKLGDTLTIINQELALKNPQFYDPNILDDPNTTCYINEEINKEIDEKSNTFTLTLNVADEVNIYTITNISNIKSNIITLDVQINDLKNTIITVENQTVYYDEEYNFNIIISDKQNNPITTEGIVTLYDQNNNIITQNTTNNGIANLTINNIKFIGKEEFIITFNTTLNYNNKTTTINMNALLREVYVNPYLNTPQEGTLDKPTTIKDAIAKVAQYGTIYILYLNEGVYLADTQININKDTTFEGVTSFNISAYNDTITINSNDIPSLITIAENYDIRLNNISIINSPNIAIYNNGTLTINGYTTYMNNIATSNGAVIYNNKGTVNIIGNNLFINNNAQNGGVIHSIDGIINIDGFNTFQNNKAMRGGVISTEGTTTININGTNKFIENQLEGRAQYLGGGAIYIANGNLTITGENLFENNSITGQSYLYGAAIASNYDQCTVELNIEGNNIFRNNEVNGVTTCIGGAVYTNTWGYVTINGTNKFISNKAITAGALYFRTPRDGTLIITGENLFENNNASSGTSGSNGAISILAGTGTVIINGTSFINNYVEQNSIISINLQKAKINITNNKFFNNTCKDNLILLTLLMANNAEINFKNNQIINNYCEKNILEISVTSTTDMYFNITNNEFINNTGTEETICFSTLFERNIKDNTYINTPLGMQEFTITSPEEGQTIIQNTPIEINITSELLHPEYYDADILDKMTYYINVNDENKYQTNDKNITIEEAYPEETSGILTIYTTISENTKSNEITVTIQKPLNTTITVTAPNENTVNKATPITIIFTDEEGNFVKDARIVVVSNSVHESLDMANGVLVYQYTPTTVGDDVITFVYLGNGTLNPTETTITLTITPDKDAIIEELNNTIQEQNNTINSLNDTVNTLNNTVQEQANTINDLNNTVQEQADTINSLNDTVNYLNNTVQEQANTINDLNNTIQEQAGTIENLNNTVQEQTDTINSLNDTVNNLNNTVEEQSSTISDLNNTVQDQASTIQNLQEQIDDLKAPKNTTIIFDEITDARFGGNVTISGSLVNEDSIGLFNQIVTLTIGDKVVNVTTKGGIFEYTTVFRELGEKTVTATYAGNDKYLASEATTTFNVEKQDITITYDTIEDVKYKDNITITGRIADVNAKGLGNINALIHINGKLYKAKTDSTGAFTLTTTATTVGTNNVTLSYGGNANYNSYETTTTFNVEKQDITITYETIEDVKYKENIVIIGRIVDANGIGLGNVNALIHINGVLYKAKTDSTGAFTFTIAANKTGTNKVRLSYGGNANYNSYECNTTFNVEKQDITITYDPIEDVGCGENVTITGSVVDITGKGLGNINALIRINGKLFKAKTERTGAFTLTTTATTEGINNVTLSYAGNDNYNSYETNTTFNVLAKN